MSALWGALVALSLSTFTYVSPFLTDVSGFPPDAIGPLLLVRGIAGVVGVVMVGFVPW